MEYFHFLRPTWGLMLIPYGFIIWMTRRLDANKDMFGGIIAPHLLAHLRLEGGTRRWFSPSSMGGVFIVVTLIILMGPSWRQQPSPLSQDESALVILLDASSSMEQRDVQPSRLQRARQKASDLLAGRPDKRTALIVYAGTAHTVLSLTADQDILNQYLAALKPGIMPRSGKFPEYALPLVDEVLRDSSAAATVVLFTDGKGADSQQAFVDFFVGRPHQLLIVGVGTQNSKGSLIPLERRGLEQLAEGAGGKYIELTVDDRDMRQVQRRIESHYVVVDDQALPWLDSGYPLVFVAMAIFILWFRKGWTITWAWLMLPLLLAAGQPAPAVAEAAESPAASIDKPWFADLWLTRDQQGRLLMQRGRYRDAAGRFQDPLWKGMAWYYAEEFMQAAEYFSRSDSDDALFNEANARAQGRDYMRAVKRYDRLLERNPQYPGAAKNRARVQQIIDDINRLSESQQQEQGVSGEDKDPGGDDAIPAQGADELSWEQQEVKQLSAEEILTDQATSDMWLRSVQQDPSNFLSIKFSMQLQHRDDAGEAK